jgi:hypothetical protein
LDHSCDITYSLSTNKNALHHATTTTTILEITSWNLLHAFQDTKETTNARKQVIHFTRTTLMIHKTINEIHGSICNMFIHDVHCFVPSRQFFEIWKFVYPRESGVVPTRHLQRQIYDFGNKICHNCQRLRFGHNPCTIHYILWITSTHRSLKDSLIHVSLHICLNTNYKVRFTTNLQTQKWSIDPNIL